MGYKRKGIHKVNKNDFLYNVASKNNLDIEDVRMMYDRMMDEFTGIMCEGKDVSLSGFGTFMLKKHKGHPVQFESKTDTVDDYYVLKFSPSNVLISKIRSNLKD